MLFKQSVRGEQSTATKDAGLTPRRALPAPSPEAGAASTTAAPVAKSVPAVAPDHGKRLIVGEGIELRGEITACDRLIVQGQVEATLNQTRVLEIELAGRFAGSCEVEEALVSGIYEGDLVVRGRLVVREGGRVAGSISYGEIELERGAQIAGELSMRMAPATAAPEVAVASEAVVSPAEARRNAA